MPSGKSSQVVSVQAVAIQNVRRRVLGWFAVFAIGLLMTFGLPIALAAVHADAVVVLLGLVVALGLTVVSSVQLGAAGGRPGSRRWNPATVWVGQAGIDVEMQGERHHFPADTLQGGWVERETNSGEPATAVLLFDGDERVHVRPQLGTTAIRVLSQLGVKASERAFVLRISEASPRARSMYAVGLVLDALLGGPIVLLAVLMGYFMLSEMRFDPIALIFVVLAVGACVLTVGLASRLQTTTLRVGTDGIRIGVLKRFLPFSQLERIDTAGRALVLRATDGRKWLVRTVSPDHALDLERQVRKALRTRAKRRRQHHDRVLRTLERGERTVETWLDGLRGLMAGATYRTAVVDSEELVRVVEDAAATRQLRVAAAYALSPSSDPEVRRRVRIAALGCADERMREALEQAAGGDVSALGYSGGSASSGAPAR